jgi:very-short-patch-repair endonuclease
MDRSARPKALAYSSDTAGSVIRRLSAVVSARSMTRSATERRSERLWQSLQAHLRGHTICRDCFIDGWRVDFLCLERRLAIRIDGHDAFYDAHGTVVLAEHGFRVLRFWSDEVARRLDGVIAEILEELADS